MTMTTVIIDAIHYGQRIAVLDTGETIPFELLLDRDGEEADEIEEAVAAVAPVPGGGYVTIDFAAFEPRPVS